MELTNEALREIVGGTMTAGRRANVASIIAGLDTYGERAGLARPHRLAQFVPQVAHESARFIYDQEIWGPTPAQRRYDTRTDLGNTPEADGDGYLYRGRTSMQLTGKANYTAFRDWCRAAGLKPPDFVANPDAVNTDPWEGLVPIWYWDVGNPEGRSLNVYADEGNNEMVTRRINGGTNGLPDRLELYTRTSLVFLGYELKTGAVADFQRNVGLKADDIDGPKTRRAFHLALLDLELPAETEPQVPGDAAAPDNRAAAIAKLEEALSLLKAA